MDINNLSKRKLLTIMTVCRNICLPADPEVDDDPLHSMRLCRVLVMKLLSWPHISLNTGQCLLGPIAM